MHLQSQDAIISLSLNTAALLLPDRFAREAMLLVNAWSIRQYRKAR